jgi:hypothetical protein
MKKRLLVIAAFALSPAMAQALERATDFEAEIAKHGEKQFARRICQSPEWAVFINGVEKGAPGWLRIAGRLRPHTDAGCASELETALVTALPNSPDAVVGFLAKYRGPNGTFSVESVCGDKSLSESAEYYQALLTALRSVKKPKSPRTMQLCTLAANSALERALLDKKP